MGNSVPLNPFQKGAVTDQSIPALKVTHAEKVPTTRSREIIEVNEKVYTLARRHLMHDVQTQRHAEKFYSAEEDPALSMSMEELLQLINKKLSQDGIKLCKSRNGRMVEDRGEFYAEIKGYLLARYVNPTTWGRELGILEEDATVFRI